MQSQTSDETLFTIRTLEERLQAMCNSGQLAADLHMCDGQEAIAVGICAALQPQDLVACHHRMIGWALARGVPPEPFVAELMGKATGIQGGLAGEMHMTALEYGFAHSFQLVGTVVPFAAGLAWALKHYKKSDGIVVCVFGDAAKANGQWHEGVNLAAVNKLPVLLVCENNHLAGNVPEDKYLPRPFAHSLMDSYGIPWQSLDGNNLDRMRVKAEFAVGWVRENSRPYYLECDTTRLGKHKQGMGDLRTKEEMTELAKRDPLLKLNLSDEKRREINEKVNAVIARARAAPDAIMPVL